MPEITTRLNEAVRQIYLIENGLDQNKNGTSKVDFDLCRSADWTGPWARVEAIDFQRTNLRSRGAELRWILSTTKLYKNAQKRT